MTDIAHIKKLLYIAITKPGWIDPLGMLDIPNPKTTGAMSGWYRSTRPISRLEVLTGRWVKVSEYDTNFIVKFSADGSLDERKLFGEATWKGVWELLSDGMLKMMVSHYELYIISRENDSICHGVEVSSQESDRRIYYQFAITHVEMLRA